MMVLVEMKTLEEGMVIFGRETSAGGATVEGADPQRGCPELYDKIAKSVGEKAI